MTRDEALEILGASLRKAKRFGELCEVDERSMQEVLAALSSCACGGREPLLKLSGIDLVYSPDDERHWLKLGLLLEQGVEDINDCDLLIMPKGTIRWENALPAEESEPPAPSAARE